MAEPTEPPEPTEQDKLVAQTLLKESDRGCTILVAGLLTDALERLLRAFFRQDPDARGSIDPLFSGYAPLASFSARIQVAYALGILSRDLRDSFEIVRRMRNDFAHDWGPIDFQDPRFADRLGRLVGRSKAGEEPEPTDPPERTPVFGAVATREQFIYRVAFLHWVSRMEGRLDHLAHLATEGHDIRRIIRAQEARGASGSPGAAQQGVEADEA